MLDYIVCIPVENNALLFIICIRIFFIIILLKLMSTISPFFFFSPIVLFMISSEARMGEESHQESNQNSESKRVRTEIKMPCLGKGKLSH